MVKEREEVSGGVGTLTMFKEGIALRIAAVSEGEAEKRLTPKGKSVTSLRVRCSGRWGIRFYELVAWDEAAEALNTAVNEAGMRLVAVGVPSEEVYKERVQRKLNVDELWVESGNGFKEVISKNGVPDEVVKPPIPLPENLRF